MGQQQRDEKFERRYYEKLIFKILGWAQMGSVTTLEKSRNGELFNEHIHEHRLHTSIYYRLYAGGIRTREFAYIYLNGNMAK